MSRTFIRQDTQIRPSDVYDDTVAPSLANFETNPAHVEDDLNNLRSMASHLKDVQAGNWFDVLITPATFTGEGETQRGVDNLNTDLHELERKRILRKVLNLTDVTVEAAQNFTILDDAAGELPANTTIAVGSVTTRGTVAADHSAAFGAHSLLEVSGSSAITPKNLCEIVDASTRDPILSAGRTIYALMQSENASDGFTATTTTPNRLQLSFVRLNATGDDLEAVPVADIENAVINYCYVERVAFDDLGEEDFLRGAATDTPAAGTVNRQQVYDNQGVTPVDLTTNATLDLEGPGLQWQIRDDLEALLFSIVEGSAGGTSQFNIHAAVDEYDNDAVVVDFASGATLNSGGTRPIAVGTTDGVIESTAGDLRLLGAVELFLDDGNQTGSTWAQTDGIKLSETTAEWDAFEAAFGETSLLDAIVQAGNASLHRKVQAAFTATVAADTDISGPATDNNIDTNLGDLSGGVFVDDYDFYFNGVLLRNGANAAANEDIYPGTSLALGQVKLEFQAKQTPGLADKLTLIAWA